MPIGNSYPKDVIIEDADLFLGTKASTNTTVNYTAQGIANYLNINGKVSITGQMSFKFVESNGISKTISFAGGGGNNTAFSSVTQFIVSTVDLSGQQVEIFLSYLNGKEILIAHQNEINSFGNYKITGYTVTINPAFYTLDLEYIGGNGVILKDNYYDVVTFSGSGGGGTIPPLDDVLTVGNTSGNSIVFTNEDGDYTFIDTLTSLNSYYKLTSPTQTNYAADYAGYGMVLSTDFEGEYRDTGIDTYGVNLSWNQGLNSGSVNLSSGGPGLGGGKITFYNVDKFGSIRINNITDNVILEFPNKPVGTYTIATTEDIPTIGSWGTLNYPTWTIGTPFVKMTAAGTFALDINTYLTGITSSDVTTALGYTPVTNARTLTINGVTYDLTANRSWTVGGTSPLTTKGDIYTFDTANTRLPIGANNQVLVADSTTATGLKWTAQNVPTAIGYYGAFQDMLTQTLALANVGQPFLIRTVDESNQVSITTNGSGELTRITPANTGVYNIQWSGQFQNPDNAIHDVNVWFRKGLVSSSGPGTDVVGSNGVIALPARKSASVGDQGHTVSGWNFLLSIAAGEYVEFYWMSNSTQITLQAYPAGSPPPSTASLIVTVTQQSGIMAGTGITAINSLTGAAQTLTTGTTGTDFAIVESGNDHKFNLPDASATARGLVTTGTQTLAGTKTLSTAPILSSLTASQLLALDASKNIQSLSTATYPSLTELSYVKGVTSSIQTQLNSAKIRTAVFNNRSTWTFPLVAAAPFPLIGSTSFELSTANINTGSDVGTTALGYSVSYLMPIGLAPFNCKIKSIIIDQRAIYGSWQGGTMRIVIGSSFMAQATTISVAVTNIQVCEDKNFVPPSAGNVYQNIPCTSGVTIPQGHGIVPLISFSRTGITLTPTFTIQVEIEEVI